MPEIRNAVFSWDTDSLDIKDDGKVLIKSIILLWTNHLCICSHMLSNIMHIVIY